MRESVSPLLVKVLMFLIAALNRIFTANISGRKLRAGGRAPIDCGIEGHGPTPGSTLRHFETMLQYSRIESKVS